MTKKTNFIKIISKIRNFAYAHVCESKYVTVVLATFTIDVWRTRTPSILTIQRGVRFTNNKIDRDAILFLNNQNIPQILRSSLSFINIRWMKCVCDINNWVSETVFSCDMY